MSFFTSVSLLPDDPILGLPAAFAADSHPQKVNLGIGSYKTAEGKSLVLSCVRKAECQILQKQLDKEYLPIEGASSFIEKTLQLIFGSHSPALLAKRIVAAQAIGGSGALHIAGEFFNKHVSRAVFLPQPTWVNHKPLFERAGLTVGSYPYLDIQTHLLDFKGMCDAIKNIPSTSVILLQVCCHNPTGIDPTIEQWRELSSLIKQQNLFPLFDIAYQGFGEGLESDAEPIRLFVEDGHELGVTYSFSKNLGLYGERVGLLAFVISDSAKVKPSLSQIRTLIRSHYSSPPLQGERIATIVLNSAELMLEWQNELSNMRMRVNEMRKALIAALRTGNQNVDFSYLSQQRGLFALLGLTLQQVMSLRCEKGIYILSNGRLNLAGLNTQNINYVAESLLSVF